MSFEILWTSFDPNSALKHLVGGGAAYAKVDLTAYKAAASVAAAKTALNTALGGVGAIKMGAFSGQMSFDPGRTFVDSEYNDLYGPLKGGVRKDMVKPVLTLPLTEFDEEKLPLIYAGATITAGTAVKTLTAGNLQTSDYLSNVILLVSYSGSELPVIFVLKNALCREAPQIQTVNKDKAILTVKFEAHFDPADVLKEPWEVIFPVVP